jgi:hypothetical protein
MPRIGNLLHCLRPAILNLIFEPLSGDYTFEVVTIVCGSQGSPELTLPTYEPMSR